MSTNIHFNPPSNGEEMRRREGGETPGVSALPSTLRQLPPLASTSPSSSFLLAQEQKAEVQMDRYFSSMAYGHPITTDASCGLPDIASLENGAYSNKLIPPGTAPLSATLHASQKNVDSKSYYEQPECSLNQPSHVITEVADISPDAIRPRGKEPSATTCPAAPQKIATAKQLVDSHHISGKFGDNSVEWNGGLYPTTSDKIPPPENEKPNLFQYIKSVFRLGPSGIAWSSASNGYLIETTTCRGNYCGINGKEVTFQMVESQSVRSTAMFHTCKVELNGNKQISTLSESSTISRDSFADILESFIFQSCRQNRAMIKDFSIRWNEKLVVNDMMALYGKIAFHAFLAQRFADEGIIPAVTQLHDEDHPLWFDCSDKNAVTCTSLNTIMMFEYVVLVDKKFWRPGDNRMLRVIHTDQHWMKNDTSTQFRRVPSAAFHIPEIKICIFSNRPNPEPWVQPPSGITSQEWWSLAERIAYARDEESDLIRGIYAAMEIAFAHGIARSKVAPPIPQPVEVPVDEKCTSAYQATVSSNVQVTEAEKDWHVAATSYWEIGGVKWCHPTDHNFVYGLANYRYKSRQACSDQIYASSDPELIQLTAALGSALIRTMTSTYLYTASITGKFIQQWINGAPPTGSFTVVNDFFRQTPRAPIGSEWDRAGIYVHVPNMLAVFTGMVIETSNNVKNWNSNIAPHLRGDVDTYFASSWPSHPPISGSVLAIDQWVHLRPREWAIGNPNPSINFEKDILLCGSSRGWYAHYGDAEYDDRVNGLLPYQPCLYGPAAMTVLAQVFYKPNVANTPMPVTWCIKGWHPLGGTRGWINTPHFQPPQPTWDANLCAFAPLTVMSFDWQTGTIISPHVALDSLKLLLTSSHMRNALFAGLLKWSRTKQGYRPMVLKPAPGTRLSYTEVQPGNPASNNQS